MKPLDAAILRTILYADVFDFPLTAAEVHFFLIHDRPVSATEVRRVLDTSPALAAALHHDGDYVMLASRPALSASRSAREQASQRLWPLAKSWGGWLARLPYVRLVAVTGALAVRNAAAADDDLDFFLLTAPGRVWLARAFAVLLVRLARLRGVTLCPNYIAATTALEQDRRDLFIAHEVAQMIPLYGPDLYRALRTANPWTSDHLPNAHEPFYTLPAVQQGRLWHTLKRLAEAGLNNRLGDALESWEQQRKLARFGRQMQQPHSAALLDATQVKGHFNDYGYRVLRAYHERLHACGLDEEPPLRATGD